ncbi:MAG: MBOAT family O-acyltransferase, partial [Myxococcota bacterium]
MLFHSATFLLSVVALLVVYWVAPWQWLRLALLLGGSLVFYGWRHWGALVILLASILVNYALGLVLERWPSRRALRFGVLLNLSLLLHYKYGRFLVEQVMALADALGVTLEAPKASAWAPLGISFFTFQMVAYLVDVYRRELRAERNLLVFGVFKSFFAQLVAGPIVRGREFLPQLHRRARFDAARLHRGAWLVLFGLFLKVAVADVLGEFVDHGWREPESLGINNAWLCVYAYAAQLLADFWGYSTMAVGLGLCFGLELPVNFLDPYGAPSLREFWRRWHITLSVWLRDYLYISLGGNRGVSKARAALNRLLTMALGGLWHGAGWNFVLWGTAHGVWM